MITVEAAVAVEWFRASGRAPTPGNADQGMPSQGEDTYPSEKHVIRFGAVNMWKIKYCIEYEDPAGQTQRYGRYLTKAEAEAALATFNPRRNARVVTVAPDAKDSTC